MGVIRLFLAICVYFVHAPQLLPFSLPKGDLAVRVFYVISGFYIALVWINKYSKKKDSFFVFWINRWLRLAPAFFIFGVFVVLFEISRTGTFRGMDNLNVFQIISIALSQLFLIGQDLFGFMIYNTQTHKFEFAIDGLKYLDPSGPYRAAWHAQPIPQGWSVGIEALFYAFTPFFVGARKTLLILLFALSTLSSIYFESFRSTALQYHFFPSELRFFIIGIFVYHLYSYFSRRFQSVLRNKVLGWSLTSILPVYGVILFTFVSEDSISTFFWSIAICIPFLFEVTKNSIWDNWIGALSFPFYISHLFFIGKFPANPWYDFALSLLASVAIVYLIEKPFDRIRHSWTEQRSAK